MNDDKPIDKAELQGEWVRLCQEARRVGRELEKAMGDYDKSHAAKHQFAIKHGF